MLQLQLFTLFDKIILRGVKMENLFNGITGKNKEKLLSYLETYTINYKKNMTILDSFKRDNIICVVIAGSLIITRIDKNGTRTIIEELDEGSIFGTTFSAINNNEYEIRTTEDVSLLIFDFDNIINFDENRLSYYTQFLKNLNKILFEKLAKNNDRIEVLTNKSTRDKLLAYFNMVSRRNGSRIIYLPFSYTDLADYLAVNRSAMTRELSNMKVEGLIETKGRRIKLLYYFG
mgnify:FL=1